jgi:succinate dehydrogenase / fumarate reductase cytochrome b subunit
VRLTDRRYATLKRLHVLSGIVPVGLFLIAHFLVNATAIGGAAAFDRLAGRLDRLPLIGWLELVVIGLPIALHVTLGALLGNAGQSFATPDGYPRRWMRPLQRWTGGILVVYVLYHVWSTRLSPEVLTGRHDLFALMSGQLRHPAAVAFYALGVLSACAHFGVGLFEVAYRWELGRPVSHRAPALGWAVFVALSLLGLAALFAFVSPAGRWLETRTEVPTAMGSTP